MTFKKMGKGTVTEEPKTLKEVKADKAREEKLRNLAEEFRRSGKDVFYPNGEPTVE